MSLSFDDIQNLWGFRICNSSSFGALAFTLCDMVASLEEEVEQIWEKPWTNLKWLYVAIRIISFGSQMISTGITLRLTREGTPTLRHCRAIAGFQGVSSVLLMMAVQTILMLRVQALYFEKKNLKLLLRGLFAAEILIVLTIFAIAMPGIKFGIYCVITSFPATATGFFIIPVLFEFLLFVMTMAKFYRAVRDGWGQEDFISRFLRDGIWAFALPFTILTANTFCLALLDSAISSVAFSWAIAIPGFASCRLILSMDHLLRTQRVSLPRTSEQEVMDTVFLTNDIVTADLITYELREPGRTPTQMDL